MIDTVKAFEKTFFGNKTDFLIEVYSNWEMFKIYWTYFSRRPLKLQMMWKQNDHYSKSSSLQPKTKEQHLLSLEDQGIPPVPVTKCKYETTLQWRHNGRHASQITSLTIVYTTVYSGSDQRKHRSSVSLAFVRGIHRWPVNSPHKWPVTRKMFPFDDVIMKGAEICGTDAFSIMGLISCPDAEIL